MKSDIVFFARKRYTVKVNGIYNIDIPLLFFFCPQARYKRPNKRYLNHYLKITKSLLLFEKKCSVGIQTTQNISAILSETKRKTELKRGTPINTTTAAQCVRCLFSEGLAHAIFLLAVLSHNQIIFQI